MRATLSLGLTLVCALFLGAQAHAEDKDDLDRELKELISKAVKAQGGKEAINKYKASEQTIKGTLDVMGMKLNFEGKWIVQIPNKVHTSMDLKIGDQVITVRTIINGDKGWIVANGNVMAMPKEVMETIRADFEAHEIATLVPLLGKGKKYKLSFIGEDKVNEKPVVGLNVKGKGINDVALYFDKKSYLLKKMEHMTKDANQGGKEVLQTLIFEDYAKDANGVMQPGKFRILKGGKEFMNAEITNVTTYEKVDESNFAKPQEED